MNEQQQTEQDPNEELHQMTIDALWHARYGTPTEEQVRLLAWHAGVDYDKEVKRAAAD